LREEEIKWYQHLKAKHLLEEDANMKYFHLLANGRHRKTRFFQLQEGDNLINGDDELKNTVPHIIKVCLVDQRRARLLWMQGIRRIFPKSHETKIIF
jgi:hypothetical protein